jgi:hypothetical protein
MAVRRFRSARRCLALTVVLLSRALAQDPTPTPYRPERHRAPFLNLSEGESVATRYSDESALRGSQTRALSTTRGDFDEDGMPDLVSGFATAGGAGAVAVHRGNVDALWPYGALRGADPPAFLPDARVFALPEAPDFLAAGDFDADGHWDIVAAHAGSTALYLLKGDGHGGFAPAERIALPGSVTAMTSGEINRADGLTDLMVAVTGAAGPQALVFESPDGALRGAPEAFDLPASATALAVIPLDGGVMDGLAIAAGHELLLVHGRDRRLTRSQAERDAVAPATVTRQSFPFALRALAVGHFTSPTQDLAALGDDGQIHILERSDANQAGSVSGSASFPAVAPPRKPAVRPAGPRPKTTAMTERSAIGLPPALRQSGGAGAKLVTARVAATGRDSLLVVDPAGGQLHVVSHSSRSDAGSLAVSASLDIAGGAPAAAEPMRINKDPFSDLVVLSTAQAEPIVFETAPDVIFTVTDTSDSSSDPHSLRYAINAAAAAVGLGNSSEIDFDIPTTDPDRNPVTGVFTIQPVGLNSSEALQPISGDDTLDAYTQPGATANTLVNGDNAHPLIEINGSLAGQGPAGFQVYGGGNTIRGFVMTNFVAQPGSSGGPSEGGDGIDLESSGNFIEGNFLGIDASGTFAKPNVVGIDDFGGEYGNTIGGTTPQARNIVTGNSYVEFAIAIAAAPNSYFIEGNYVGTDKTGARGLISASAGVALAGLNAVVGGATAGAGNLISGAGAENVNIEQEQNCQNCQPAEGNLVQGNYIGTDLTGTKSLPIQGNVTGVYLIQATNNTVGGTTPAARNIISGNGFTGLSLVGGSVGNIVEGNYIGLDVTGTQAVGNGGAGVTFGVSYTSGNTFYNGSPAVNNLIGGETAGSANVISANSANGINVSSASGTAQNNVIAGNLIGADASGVNPLGNQGDGILLQAYAASNTVGGTTPGAANVIAYNTGNGVDVSPGAGVTSNNSVTGNAIYSNNGAGVRIPTGNGNTISHNQIYSNGALGIDIDAAGVLANSACQANTSGANLLQNAPVLTAGAGSTLVSATATDPHGNTSEFSNCVATALAGNVLTIAGALNSTPSTNYTIEYFSNTACDASGHGQGKVYLGSTAVTTNAGCTAPVGGTLNLTNADLGVVYTSIPFDAIIDVTFPFVSVVSNNGPALATSVTWTDVLPAGFLYLSATATQGTCGFAAGAITCNIGNLPVGETVTVSTSVVATAAVTGAFSNTVVVAGAQPDSNPANNSATFTLAGTKVLTIPSPDHLTPYFAYVGSPATAITVVGQGFTPATAVTYGGVAYPATFNGSWNPNDCGIGFYGGAGYCTALTITVPASQLTAVATVQVVAGNGTLPFYIENPPAVVGPVAKFVLAGLPSPFPAATPSALTITAEDANGLTVTNYSGTLNLTSSDPAFYVLPAGGGNAVAFPTSKGGVLYTVIWLQTFGAQSITATDASNSNIKGTLSGIVVGPGPAANLTLSGSPQATPPGHAFALPLSVKVTDENGYAVPNQVVTFTAPTSGSSAVLSSGTATTNSLGVASVTATANGISGAYEVAVSFPAISGVVGANADVFLLNNGSGLATLTATAGTPQSTFLGQLFPTKLQATLLDGLGVPISGTTVYFTNGPSNGSYAFVTFAVATNSSGVAATTANAALNASAGTVPIIASVGGLTAIFTLTEQTAAPVVMTATGGSPQTTAIGTPFGTPLTVYVTNGFGHPLAGVVVTFVPATSNATATLSAGTAITNSLGYASLNATANGTLGTYNVVAGVDGVTAAFTLTNGPPQGSGPPASITATAGTPQSQTVNTAFATALKVLVKDATNTPLSGASVTFSAPAAGPSGTFTGSATVLSDGNGNATAPTFTANTVTGSYLVTATAGGFSTTFSLTNLAGPPASMAVYSGNNQSATINTNFGTPVAVQFEDAYGNPTGANLSVSFSITAGTSGAVATTTGALSVNADGSGTATVPTLTANGIAGAFTVVALYINYYNFQVLVQDFTLTNTTSVPAAVTAVAGTPQSAAAGTAFPTALSAKVTDVGSNPLAGFTVTFTPPGSGASATLSSLSAITNSSGIASVTAAANGTPGSYVVTASSGSASGASFSLKNTGSLCDVNQDGLTNVADVQWEIDEALGTKPAINDLNLDGVVNVVDVQIEVNAALGLGCSAK